MAATPDHYKQPLLYPHTPATPREENKSRRMVGFKIIFHNFVVVASFFYCFFDLFWEKKYFEAHTISPTFFLFTYTCTNTDRLYVFTVHACICVWNCVSTKLKLLEQSFHISIFYSACCTSYWPKMLKL